MILINSLFSNHKTGEIFHVAPAASSRWFFVFLIVAIPLFITTPAVAVEVNYIGNDSELENTPSWFSIVDAQSLFPSVTGVPLASGNKVIINYLAGNGTADSHSAYGTANPHFVIGGMSQSGEVNNNIIILLNGRVENSLYGGWSGSGNVLDNSVVISGGSVYFGVYGGWNDGVGDVIGNAVSISNGFVDGYVYGGWSDTGTAANNVISISGGTTVGVDVYGGWSNDGAAYGNIITISGSSVGGVVIGGVSIKDSSANNGVTVSDSGGVAGNAVIISGGSFIGGNVTGGLSSTNGGARDNAVIISDSLAGASVYGGRASRNDDARNNSVYIINSRVEADVYGGYSYHNVVNNSVSVNGGYVGGNIYGGHVDGHGDATNNTVTISGSPVFSAGSYIYGGYVKGAGENFTGNALNLKSSNIAAAGVGNFEYYNFYLPKDTEANDTMLSVTSGVDLDNATVEIYLQGSNLLQAGDKVILIGNDSGGIIGTLSNDSSQTSLGTFLTFDFDIYSDKHDLWAELTSVKTSSSNKALTNSRTAPLAFLNQGADLAASLEHLEVSGDSRYTAFAIVGGGSSTYDTGSDVDIDSFSVLAGVTRNAHVKKNSLALSAFVEAGWSSYDTTNNISGSKDIKGSGDADYFGGGLHARYKWGSGAPGGLYAEGSFRYGRVSTNFDTNDLRSQPAFHYDSGSKYYGAHAGLGYVWQLSGKNRLEVSGKYLWTHLESDELTASSGDQISFDSANSSRLRAGFRLYHDYGSANAVTLYYGAAFEYEFDGDADGRLYGTYALDASSLSGGSGIGELGVNFRPSRGNDRLTMQLGVQGYVGVREGISGALKLQYAF